MPRAAPGAPLLAPLGLRVVRGPEARRLAEAGGYALMAKGGPG